MLNITEHQLSCLKAAVSLSVIDNLVHCGKPHIIGQLVERADRISASKTLGGL